MVRADSHRILRNTGALYVRMLLVMAVSLYISRVVLAALGVDDYGIYNVVGGIVVFFSFLTGALSLSIQRFLAADLGRGDLQAARRTFSVSLQVHAVLAVVLLLAAETLGVWFLTTQLNIPAGRMAAAGRVFQFTLLSFVAKLFVVPFNAAVIAHERMSFYAYLSLLEAALNGVMINSAQKVIVLADSSKFGRRGFSRICSLDSVDMIITDSGVQPHILKELRERGIEVRVVEV